MSAATRYRSTIQIGHWFFGFTLGRLSFFAAIKSDSTWRNYARLLEYVGNLDARPSAAPTDNTEDERRLRSV